MKNNLFFYNEKLSTKKQKSPGLQKPSGQYQEVWICVIGVPWKEKKTGVEKIFEKIQLITFQIWCDTSIQIHKTQWTAKSINAKKTIPVNIIKLQILDFFKAWKQREENNILHIWEQCFEWLQISLQKPWSVGDSGATF